MPKPRRPKRLPLGSDDRPDRPENLPQGIEMLDFTPGFSAPPGNRRPRRTAARATPRLRPARSGAGTARADDRPENLPQGIEMLDFAPGFSAPPGSRGARRTDARSGAGTARADDRPCATGAGWLPSRDTELRDYTPSSRATRGRRARGWRSRGAWAPYVSWIATSPYGLLAMTALTSNSQAPIQPGLAVTIARKTCRKALKCLISRPGFSRRRQAAARAEPPQDQHPAFAIRAAEQGPPAPTIARKTCRKALKCLISRPGFPRRREAAARAEPLQDSAFAPRATGRGDRRRPTLARKIRRKALITLNPRPGFVRGHTVRVRRPLGVPKPGETRTRTVRAILKGVTIRQAAAARALVWFSRSARAMGAFPFCQLGRSP